jgi:hypothetical protein
MRSKQEPSSKIKDLIKDEFDLRDARSTQVISSSVDVKEEAAGSKDRKHRSRSKQFIAKAKELVIKTEPKRERSSSKQVKFES